MTIEPSGTGDDGPRRGPSDPAEVAEAVVEEALSAAARDLVDSAAVLGRRPVWVLNGVNLGRLGLREPAVYGSTTHAQLTERLIALGLTLSLDVDVRQTDDEATLVGWLHAAADAAVPVVLNPAAWTHYSVAVRDAVAQRSAELVEVHISNVHTREEFRHRSVISGVATGVIAGLGLAGYELALRYLAARD